MSRSLPEVLRAERVHFAYREAAADREVLRGVDLRVGRGELVAIVGPNGSGKTTLLRVVSGVERAQRGHVTLLCRPIEVWRRAEVARRVAVLPQSLELPTGFRVAEVVAMARAPHARGLFRDGDADRRAVEAGLEEAGAADLAERRVGELSGGERQRVLVAMVLAQEPEVLMLDEPTVHLDVAHSVAVLQTVAALRARRGLTVLAVIHDLGLAAAFAPRVAVLHGGRVVGDGPPDEVLVGPLVSRVFGVEVEEAWTASGRRALVPLAAQPARAGTEGAAD